jgi:hypothetical protein
MMLVFWPARSRTGGDKKEPYARGKWHGILKEMNPTIRSFWFFALMVMIVSCATPPQRQPANERNNGQRNWIGPFFQEQVIRRAVPILGPEAKKKLERIARAVVKAGVRDTTCSGVFTSSSGHLVTALHCLEDAIDMKRSNHFKEKAVGDRKNDNGSLPSLAAAKEDLLHRKVKVYYVDVDVTFGAKTTATVLYVGAGYPYVFPDRGNLPAAIYLGNLVEDIAVLKFDSLPRGFGCAKAGFRRPLDGETLLSFGHPVNIETPLDSKRRKLWGDGKDEEYNTFSRELFRKDREDLWAPLDMMAPVYVSSGTKLQSYSHGADLFGFDLDPTGLGDSLSPGERTIITTAPLASGMSGGGVFDAQGALLGIHTMKVIRQPPWVSAFDSEEKIFTLGVTAISLSYLKQQLLLRLGEEETRKIFDCDLPSSR